MKNYIIAACALVLFVLITVALISQPSHAAGPWYVAPSGSDSNTCLSVALPCATINGALGKPGFTRGDTILVASGTYTGAGGEVVSLGISVTLSGGWNSDFTEQAAMSTIDGQGARRGVTVNSGVTATLERLVVRNASDYFGGGIANDGALTLNSCTVADNQGGGSVGGINNGGTLVVNESVISGNMGGPSGGIANQGTLTLNRSTVSGNAGNHKGGGIYNSGTTTLNNSTLSNNLSHNMGGGIYNDYGTLILNNSLVSGNTTENEGGGIYSDHGTVKLNNGTISDNTGNIGGGIIGVAATLQNTILAENMARGGPDCSGGISSVGYNLIGNTSGCTFAPGSGDLTDVDSRLGPLEGSPAYHPLLPGSPAINAGNPAGCTDHLGSLLTTDQRGLPRFGRCDIGAYELQPIEFSTKAVNRSTGLPGTPLTYTVALTNGGPNLIANIVLTDVLPTSLTYHGNSLSATDGTYGFNGGVITWTGSLSTGNRVTLTFGATASETVSLGTSIVNTAIISGAEVIFSRTATFNVDGQVCNLAKYASNPVLTVGANGAWDDTAVWRPTVLKEGSAYKMWYSASDGTTRQIGYATSPDGIHWTKYGGNPVLVPGPEGAYDAAGVYAPSVIYDGSYKMWYTETNSDGIGRIGYATSPDGITWTKDGSGYVLNIEPPGSWEDEDVTEPTVIKVGSIYHMWYVGNDGVTLRIGHATSIDGVRWVEDAANPVLDLGSPGGWDWLDVYSPSVVKVGNEYKLWYSGGTLPAAYQTGYATSLDGSTWTRQQKLIAQGPLNTFDVYSADYPAVIVDGAGYKIWYSGLNSSGTYNIGYATAGICGTNPPATIASQVYLPLIIKSPSCQAYYSDNFSDPNSGWPISDDGNRRYAYVDGEYQLLVKNKNNAWFVTPGAKATDFAASVSARRVSGTFGAYGILFGINENWYEFYEVLIDANSYSIWRYNFGWSVLKDWTSSPYIATGTNWNRLKVVRSGANISFYVNDHLLITLSDGSLMGLRRIGLVAESDNTAVDVRFDNFALYPANCGSQVYAAATSDSFEMGKTEAHPGLLTP